MLHQTAGIVISTIKYGETSLIARIYTELLGMQTYMIKGVRKGKSTFHPALLQPLTPLDLVVYKRENRSLQHLKEAKLAFSLSHMPFQVVRTSLALFSAEVLHHALHAEEPPNPELFAFLCRYIALLDAAILPAPDIHLAFIQQLSTFLGFVPLDNYDVATHPVLDMQAGMFVADIPLHPHHLDGNSAQLWQQILHTPIEQAAQLRLTRTDRQQQLRAWLQYYSLHLDGFKEVRSLKVLEEVLSYG